MLPPLGHRDHPYDLIVVGGGINGTAIARDAVLRGMSVALFEMRDFSTGATWSSSGMIHGGLRYLRSDPEVTRLACLDSGYIQKIAPHLIFRIPFLMPWLDSGGVSQKVVFELAEVYFDAYDRYQPLKRGLQHARLTPEETIALAPGIRNDLLGALTMDEWGIDAQRLTVVNAVDAAERGADIHTYTKVESLLRDGPSVRGVRVHDRVDGGRREVFGKAVFNACGPWAMQFAEAQGVHSVKVRPGKGIHLVLAGRVSNYAVISETIDGRQIFVCPQQNTSIIGTTDDDYYGDLEQIPILHDEVEYLLEGMAHVLPSIRRHPIIGTTAGCRPTLYEYGKHEDALSREHRVWDHGGEGFDGLFSMAGGKLASFRVMAEEAVDIVAAKLGVSAACTTHEVALPGGESTTCTLDDFAAAGVDRVTATRILYRQGSRAERVLAIMEEQPRTRAVVDPSEPVTDAELRLCIREELVRTLDDLKRRCRLGIGVDRGARGVARAAQIFCEETGRDRQDAGEIARDFLQARWHDRRTTGGRDRRAEELALAHWMRAAALGDGGES